MNALRSVFVAGASLCISALTLGIGACGGGGGSSPAPPPVPPSYTLTVSALSPTPVSAGNTATSAIEITPAHGYTGSVTLSCSMSGAGAHAPSCSINPAAVTISGVNAGASKLTVTTSTSTPGGSYPITVTAIDGGKLAPSNGPQPLTLTAAAVIQHVVIIFQENRSVDNLFHDPVLIARGADIASSGVNSSGQTIQLSAIDLGTAGSNPTNFDLGHKHTAFVAMYDNGKMDGADLTGCAPAASCPANAQFHYVTQADVQPYFTLAEQYTFGDRMFQSNEGPSFPAHQFIISGTSAPTATSPLFDADNPLASSNGNPLASAAGCLGALTNTVVMVDATGSETNSPPQYPCFEHPTLTDNLDAKGVTWRYYTPSAGSIWTGPVAIKHMCLPQTVSGALACTGTIWSNVIIPQSQVLTDIANGQLAQVTWVIPDGKSSDHALLNDGSGPSWVASVVNAIGKSAYWDNVAIIIAWDDWGGWFDHVKPTVINDGVSWGSGYVYGFRVPLIVVSPYAKAAYVSHVNHDFGSIVKFIETTFSLPSLGYADANADDLSDCFELTHTPLTYSVIPAPVAAAHFINDKRPATDPDDD